jgi:hypothetical protein
MRASLFLVPIAMLWACGSSSSPAHSNTGEDGGGSGDDGGFVYNAPDSGVNFTEGGAKMLYQIGEQCMHSSDCISGGCNHIDEGFPGGLCVADCSVSRSTGMPRPCPTGSSCTILNADSPTCYKSCNSDSDCRTAEMYHCLDIGAALTQTGSSKICYPTTLMPNCNFDTDCPPSTPHCTVPADAGLDAIAPTDDAGNSNLPQPGVGTCGP